MRSVRWGFRGPSAGLTLLELLTLIVVLALLYALLLPGLTHRPGAHKKRDCRNNLLQLGRYIVMYQSKYGSGRDYPSAAGLGFFQSLRTIPSPQKALVAGSDSLFVCRVSGTSPSPTACDYREPRVRIVDGLTNPMQPIACDRPTNHDPSGQDDINVLLFSGSVATVTYGSPEWTTAMKYTK